MPRRKPYYPERRGQNPETTPCWRSRRVAEMLVSGQNASLKRDDQQTVEFTRFIRTFLRRKQRAAENLLLRNRGMATAAYLASATPDALPELHARLLANQGSATIEAAMDLPPDAATWYGDLFYDVRPRLHAVFWIQFKVLRCSPDAPDAPAQLFLQSAYRHGSKVIPAWLDYLDNHHGPHDLSTELGRQRESIAILVDAQALTSPRTQSPKSIRMNQLLREIDPETFRNRSTGSQVVETLATMVGEMSFPLRSTEPHIPKPNNVSAELGRQGKLASFLADVDAVRDALYAFKFRSRTTSVLVAQ